MASIFKRGRWVACIQLRPETTKAKRADVLPLRDDLAALMRDARGEAGDTDRVFRTMPSMMSHKGYLTKAGIDYEDEQGRRADFHSLRHTYGTMLGKAGIAPRVAMSLMRHTDMRLTMNVYTDPRVFDMAGAVGKLPALAAITIPTALATGTDDAVPMIGVSESVSSPKAGIGYCSAVNGKAGGTGEVSLSLVGGGNWQQKTPSGKDGDFKRVKGVEPSTFTLAT